MQIVQVLSMTNSTNISVDFVNKDFVYFFLILNKKKYIVYFKNKKSNDAYQINDYCIITLIIEFSSFNHISYITNIK